MDKPIRIACNSVGLNAPSAEQLSSPAARIIDPVLTTAARGYRHPMHVARMLFPAVPTGARGGNRIEFNRDDFRRVNSLRAPGAATRHIQFGHRGVKFALDQHRLAGKQPLEPAQDAAMVAGVDMNMRTVDGVQAVISLEKEIDAAIKATTAASYDATHVSTPSVANRWDADGSSPTDQVASAISAIRQETGMRPNTMVLGGQVYDKVRVHPDVKQQIRYKDGGKQIASKEDLAMLWDIPNVYVGDAIYVDEDDATTDVWGAHVVIAYTKVGSATMYEPSYGYTYQLAGTPLVEEPDFDRNENSWLYYVCDEYSQEIVGADAGYLIRNAVA